MSADRQQLPDRWSSHFPIGARVHHGNQLWTRGWTEQERQENPQWGWGTVLEVETRYADRSGRFADLEVKVRKDAPLSGEETLTWWPAWLIDEVHPVVLAAAFDEETR